MAAARRGYLRPVGEWNFQEVTVQGPTIKVELNGTRILDADLSKVTEFMDGKAHPGKDRKAATSASPATATRWRSATSGSSRSNSVRHRVTIVASTRSPIGRSAPGSSSTSVSRIFVSTRSRGSSVRMFLRPSTRPIRMTRPSKRRVP